MLHDVVVWPGPSNNVTTGHAHYVAKGWPIARNMLHPNMLQYVAICYVQMLHRLARALNAGPTMLRYAVLKSCESSFDCSLTHEKSAFKFLYGGQFNPVDKTTKTEEEPED